MNKDSRQSDIFATFFHLSPNLSCIANKDAVFEYLSPNWELTLGWSIATLTAHPFLHFVHKDDLDLTQNEMKKLGEGQITLDFENRYRTKSGDYVNLCWHSIFQQDRYFAVAKDVTKLRRLEAIQDQSLVSARLALIGEMTCGIAHEISTPLAIINESIQLANDASSPNELTKLLKMMENASKQMSHIVKGMRMVTGPATAKDRKAISLREIATHAESFFKSKLNRDNIEFKNSVDDAVLITAIPGDVLQVLINLISNSHYALSSAKIDAKWIELSSESKTNTVFVKITDSGPGIAPDIVDKIMNPFFTTKESIDGVGLGLSISKRIAEQNKGRLYYAKSAQHTQFVLELPTAPPPTQNNEGLFRAIEEK